MVGFGSTILTKAFIFVAIASQMIAPLVDASGVQGGVTINVLADTVIGVVTGVSIGVFARVDVSRSVTTTALDSIPMLAPSEEVLFRW